MSQSPETPFIYVEPSPLGQTYLDHVKALEPCRKCPESKAFTLPSENYDLECLRDIVNHNINVGKLSFVVLEHGEPLNLFEVRRLKNNSNIKLFYKYCDKSNKAKSNNKSVQDLKRLLKEYCDLDYEAVIKYDKGLKLEAFEKGIVSRMYLQRKTASLSSFKNNKMKATEILNEAIEKLKDKNILSEVDKKLAKFNYSKSGQIFFIHLNEI